MAVHSTMLPLGSDLPAFSLPDVVTGELVSSASFSGKPLLLTVICNHCPYVVRIKKPLSEMARDFIGRGVNVVAISSNDVTTHPQDGPQKMKEEASQLGYPFPYLFDESQALAAALQAMCTPEFYLFDSAGQLVYRGRLDDSTPGNEKPVTGDELKAAVDALLSGAPPIDPQLPSMGCSVKWKAGNVPAYVNG